MGGGSHREVTYALANDRRTLLWFANQRAVEYHPALMKAPHWEHQTHLIMDLDPPAGVPRGGVRLAVGAARLVQQALADPGLPGVVKTSGSKGVHVFVPLATADAAEDVAAATRAVAARAERLDPDLATTAFIREDRHGKVFLDSTRAGGATVVAAYSPRIRPGVPVSFPVAWDALDEVTPADFTVRTAPDLWSTATPGRRGCRSRRSCRPAWSRRDTPSRSPGSRRCTRASAGPAPNGKPTPTEPKA